MLINILKQHFFQNYKEQSKNECMVERINNITSKINSIKLHSILLGATNRFKKRENQFPLQIQHKGKLINKLLSTKETKMRLKRERKYKLRA